MYDGAKLDFADNVATTRRIVDRANAAGVLVEAELGEIGGKDGAHAPGVRTDPDEAARFVAETGVGALAVAVGSSHAMTERVAAIDHELVARLAHAVPVPLVLHGSSGVPDESIVRGIRAGLTKINVSTHLNARFTGAIREYLAANPAAVDSRTLRRGRPRCRSARGGAPLHPLCLGRDGVGMSSGLASGGLRPMLESVGTVRGRWLALAAIGVLLLGCTPSQRTDPVQPTPQSPEPPAPGLIAFVSNRDGSDALFVMSADGGNVRRLTPDLPPVSHPSWSADGQRIAFNAGSPTASDIYLIDRDGSGLTQVTRNAHANFYPTWSPDGSRLAFSSNRDGDWDIYVMNADGSRVRQLVDSAGLDDKPQWSPDGSRIGFTTTRDGSPQLLAVDPDTGAEEHASPPSGRRPQSGLVVGRIEAGVQRRHLDRVRYRGDRLERRRPQIGSRHGCF